MLSQDEKSKLRSHCPINYSLEMFGDSWSLLILRDIIFFGKKTYGEFLASNEHIARNILANRLEQLQMKGLLEKHSHPTDQRKDLYEVTEAGLDILPILMELTEWGAKHDTHTLASKTWLTLTRTRRAQVIARSRKTIRGGGSVFAGKNNAFDKLTAQKSPGK